MARRRVRLGGGASRVLIPTGFLNTFPVPGVGEGSQAKDLTGGELPWVPIDAGFQCTIHVRCSHSAGASLWFCVLQHAVACIVNSCSASSCLWVLLIYLCMI